MRAIEVILRPKSLLTLLDNDTNFGINSLYSAWEYEPEIMQ